MLHTQEEGLCPHRVGHAPFFFHTRQLCHEKKQEEGAATMHGTSPMSFREMPWEAEKRL